MYKSKKYFEEGLNFADVFPEKQEVLKTTQNFDFDLQEVADFIRINSQDYSVSQPELEAVDKQVEIVVDLWQNKSQPTPTPKSAPKPKPEPEPQGDDDDDEFIAKIRAKIEIYTETLEVIDNPKDRALIEFKLDALRQSLEYAEE